MTKWIVFAIGSLVWLAICWFFGSMVGGTDGGPRGSIAEQECGQRLVREGRHSDFFAARDSDECRQAGRAARRAAAAPAERNGLLVGLLPVLVIGGIMAIRARR